MARNIIQNAFNAGEITPQLSGRSDSPSYQQGCRTLENFIVEPLGGVSRRPGTRYAFTVKDATKPTRIFPFSYRDERHMVEVGEDYLRIWEQNISTGVWTVAQDTEGLDLPRIDTGATEGHWLSPWYGTIGTGRYFWILETSMDRFPLRSFQGPVHISGAGLTFPPGGLAADTDYWMYVWPGELGGSFGPHHPPPNRKSRTVIGFCESLADAQKTAAFGAIPQPDTVTLLGIGTGTGQWNIQMATSDNEWEFVSPWQDADMPQLRSMQVDDSLYFYDGNNPIYVLRRMDYLGGNTQNLPAPDTNWTKPKWAFSEVTLTEGPWVKRVSWNGTPAQSITVTTGGLASAADGWLDPAKHVTGYIDLPEDYIPSVEGAGTGYDFFFAQKTGVPSEFMSGVTSEQTPDPAGPFTMLWDVRGFPTVTKTPPVDVVCDTFAAGFAFRNTGPNAAGWFDGRLVLSGGPLANEVHFSSLEHPWVYLPVDTIDGAVSQLTAFSFDIAGDKDNKIVAYSELQDLLVFSGDGVWAVTSNNGTEGTSVTTVDVRQIATIGCSAIVEPLRMHQSVAYMSKANKRLQLIQYNFDAKDYRSFDILEHNNHLLEDGAKFLAYQDEPYDKVWVVRNNGTLVSVTIQRGEGVVGPGAHSLGGTTPTVEDIFTIPNEDSDADVVYMVVKREVNSADIQFVEYMDTPVKLGRGYSTSNTKSDAYFVDCGMTFTGAISSFTMAHLPNETVDVLTDGDYYGTVTLNGSGESGALTGAPFSKVQAGYTYTSELEPMPPVYETQGGTTAGSLMDMKSATIRFQGTKGGSCGDRVDESTDADGHSVLGVIPYPNPDDLFSGDISVTPEIQTSVEPTIVIRQTKPYPMTVNAISYRAHGSLAADSEGRSTNQ